MKYYMMTLCTFILIVTVLFPLSTTAAEDEMVHVRLVNHVGDTSELNIHIKGNYLTLDPTLPIEKGGIYTVSATNGSMQLKSMDGKTYQLHDSLILIPESYDKQHIVYINERPYLGAMELRLEGKKTIRPVNQLPLEDYLKGVVPFEVFASWGLETLKAQALAARTYAASQLDQEIDDTISYQVYGGYTWNDKTTKAVNETKGEVITYNNKLISAFYSASNGGMTESNANVWSGKKLPYFPIKKDPYDPVHPWEFTLNETQIDLDKIDWDDDYWWNTIQEKNQKMTATIKKKLAKKGYIGDLKIVSIPEFKIADERLDSGRSVKGSITIEFLQQIFDGTVFFRQFKLKDVPLNRIRPMIGGSTFKSYFIDALTKQDGIYTMKGRGYGHGVGMSQWGAQVMGENGHTYRDIIDFYYPGTTILDYKNKKGKK